MTIGMLNDPRFDLNLLPVLEALYDARSVTGAARRLKLSQPTVSLALNRLREAFKDELFLREASGMQPTPFAQSLEEPVRRILAMTRRDLLGGRAFDPKTAERSFTLSTSDIGELVFLPKLLPALREEAPGVTLRFVSLPPAELQAAMAGGDIDLVFGYFPDLQGAAIRQQRLFEHPFTCLARKGHPFIGEGLTLEAFLAAEHAVVEAKGRSQEIAERRMAEMGLKRRILLRSPHFMSLPLLVAGSDVISITPLAVGRAFARIAPLQLLEPPFPIPQIELRQFWHRRLQSDPAAVWLRGLFARLYRGRDPSVDLHSPIFGI